MGFVRQFKEALLNLLSAKLRSTLAILGILVGTGSVVALITTSQLATTHALAQFKTLGTNLLAVSIFSRAQEGQGVSNQLSLAEAESLSAVPGVESIGPYVTSYQTISYKGKPYQGAVLGAYRAFADIAKIKLVQGRFVNVLDGASFHAVIGMTLAKKLAAQGLRNPIGKQLEIGPWYFTIVGVLAPWQPNLFVYVELNNSVIVPIETMQLLSNSTGINNLLVRVEPGSALAVAQNKLKERLQKLIPSAQLSVHSPQEILDLMGKQQKTYTWLLGAIGGISLLVGGIGVMNIMLVSVIERRREIGVRLAIGARQSNILWMFLIESVMLTLLGGILGIIIGLGVSYGIAKFSGWTYYFYVLPPLLGFIVSVLVGLISGFYPAFRASRLDPIDSLRAE